MLLNFESQAEASPVVKKGRKELCVVFRTISSRYDRCVCLLFPWSRLVVTLSLIIRRSPLRQASDSRALRIVADEIFRNFAILRFDGGFRQVAPHFVLSSQRRSTVQLLQTEISRLWTGDL